MRKQGLVRTLCMATVLTVLPLALILSVLVASGVLSEEFFGAIGFVPYLSNRHQVELSPWRETLPPPAETDKPSNEPFDGIVMEVYSDVSETVYLKQYARGDFDGQTWQEAEAYPELLQGTYSIDYLPGLSADASAERHELTVTPILPGISVIPYYLHASGAEGSLQIDDVGVSGTGNDSYTTYFSLYEPDRNTHSQAEVADYEARYAAYARETYLHVDTHTAAYIRRIIREQGFDASDPDIIEKVASYVQNAAFYNLRYNRALDSEKNVVIAFLETYKEGVCRHYANVATLIYRTLGIPARYVEGFCIDTVAGETIEVHSNRAHAWTEVYVDGFGWRYVEVTGAAQEKIPVAFQPVSLQAKYDGKEQFPTGEVIVTGFADYEAQGYTYQVEVTGSRTDPGASASRVTSAVIYDANGNDVSHFFDIDLSKTGVIHVYLARIVLRSLNISLPYNGYPQAGSRLDYYIDREASASANGNESVEEFNRIVRGYQFELTGRPQATGSHSAEFDYAITKDGADCKNHFLVTKLCGTITITPTPLILIAGSATEFYGDVYNEDTPLTSSAYSFGTDQGGTLRGLLGNDRIVSITTVGEIGMPGTQANVINPGSVMILNDQDEDVTAYYKIEYVDGELVLEYDWSSF